jgi:hypothetical protein
MTDSGDTESGRSDLYAVSLRGRLGDGLRDAFGPLVATTRAGTTTLTGPIEDQAALLGLLAKIQNLGLELDEVRRLPDRSIDEDDR